MNHKFINKYSEFILNETLKTHDIDLSIKNIEEELSLLRYDFSIRKLNNTILITLNNLNTTHMLGLLIKNLDNLLIDRHGWFPSIMILESISGVKNKLQYDREYFLEKQAYFKSIEILYEPRYDVELNIPKKSDIEILEDFCKLFNENKKELECGYAELLAELAKFEERERNANK